MRSTFVCVSELQAIRSKFTDARSKLQPGIEKQLFFYDPDGNALMLAQDLTGTA